MARKKINDPRELPIAERRRAYLTRPKDGGARLISDQDAVPAKGQHTRPCADCPWARESLPGWTGSVEPETWIRGAHGEDRIECHTLTGAQCAGAAIYRANVAKHPRDPETLKLRPDHGAVFSEPSEFIEHHTKGGKA